MKRFSSQLIITNTGPPLSRAVITTEDDGSIINIEDTGGILEEKHSIEFHNGIIIPGFVNCHCHLELSHMRSSIPQGKGLGEFISQIRNNRENNNDLITAATFAADNLMYQEGIVLCADICNTSLSFNVKKESKISYVNLLEVFGIDPGKAEKRISDIMDIAERSDEMDLPFAIVPHSVYSVSLPLFRLIQQKSINNKITSMHFMETKGEKDFVEKHSGSLMMTYEQSGLLPLHLETVKSHAEAVMSEITPAGNLMLVHNTFADRDTINKIRQRKSLFWCLCPNSNLYIENELPPLKMLVDEGCEIVIGTDSLASNNSLSILAELKTLQNNFPSVTLEELVRFGTYNGALALGEEDRYGRIETGKKPGLLLLQNVDLVNMKLLPESYVSRLV